jgi:hypothetical protein
MLMQMHTVSMRTKESARDQHLVLALKLEAVVVPVLVHKLKPDLAKLPTDVLLLH